MSRPLLRVSTLPHHRGLAMPSYRTEGAAGMDIVAAVESAVLLQPLRRYAVPTGLRVAIPPGYEGQLRPRSGLALNRGLSIPNAPGTIDSDYRGEVKVLVVNLGDTVVTIERGMRIAQLVIAPVARAELEVVDDLEDTARGAGGFGSTGVR